MENKEEFNEEFKEIDSYDTLEAKLAEVRDMYNSLLDKYKKEIELRAIAENNLKAFYLEALKQGWIKSTDKNEEQN